MSETGQSCYWPRALIHVRADRPFPRDPAMHEFLTSFGDAYRIVDATNVIVDITHRQVSRGSPEQLAHSLLQELVRGLSGPVFRLACAADPMAAACAAALTSPFAVESVAPWETKPRLAGLSPTELAFAYPGLASRMKIAGLSRCGQILDLSPPLVRRYMGQNGVRLWHLCRHGRADATVEMEACRDRIRFRTVLPPKTGGSRALKAHLRRLHQEASRVMRVRGRIAHTAELRARLDHGQWTSPFPLGAPVSAVGFLPIVKLSQSSALADGRTCRELELNLADLRHAGPQMELFADEVTKSADSETSPYIPAVEMYVR